MGKQKVSLALVNKMRYKNNITVFDTETTGDFNTPLIYDIGWYSLNNKLETVDIQEYLVKEIFESHVLMNSAYYASKKPMYEQRVKEGLIELKPFREILKDLMTSMGRNGKVLGAYNIAFDHRAILATTKLVASDMLDKVEKWLAKTELLCIWNLATDTILARPEFKEMAIEQGWVSGKGNIKTSAEIAYRVLSGDYEFIEEHTALKDVEIEVAILRECLTEYKGNVSYGAKYGCWQKVNKGE